MTRQQCKAARALLGWKQSELASSAKVATKTLIDFERGQRKPQTETLEKIRQALLKEGIVFISDAHQGVGVQLKK